VNERVTIMNKSNHSTASMDEASARIAVRANQGGILPWRNCGHGCGRIAGKTPALHGASGVHRPSAPSMEAVE